MTAPRVHPPAALDADQADALERTFFGSDGEPLNVFRTLTLRPKLLRHLSRLGGYFPSRSSLATRERELVILRVAAHARSPYVAAHHREQASTAGITDTEMAAAEGGDAGHRWSVREAALLRFTDELLRDDTVSDATWGEAGEHLAEEQLVDLVALIGFYRLFAGIANVLRVEDDGFRSRY